LSSQIVGLEKSGKNIIVGCMDNGLYCYTTKGRRLWKIDLPSFIITMSSMEIKSKGIQAVIVSLNNKEVHIFRDKYLISKLTVEDPVVGIKFGKFGREEGNLLMTTRSNY
jgi:Bardet-Biedl syndrome 1 protein